MLIQRDRSLLLVVDIQEKLAPAIADGPSAVSNALKLIAAANRLAIPLFLSEQYVRGLGQSLPEIRNAAVNAHIFEKTSFSCPAEPGVLAKLQSCQKQQAILCGMEAHVCVLQTAFGLREAGFDVFVVGDAVGSRTPENRRLALERMRACGIHIVSTEMVIFEWLGRAGSDEFRAVLPLIK